MMRLLTVALLLLLTLAGAGAFSSPVVRAQDGGKYSVAGLDDEREVNQFFLSFKEAVGAGDKRRVASMVSYPIRAHTADGRWVRLRNGAALVRSYERIFDPAFRRLIAETRVEDLWAKSSGVATPRGEIWINGVVTDERRPDSYVIRITSINGRIPE